MMEHEILRNASAIHGCAIQAIDGKISTVSDILFDQGNWLVHWLVVDTGDCLPGRKLLLPASVLGHINLQKQEFAVRLTMEQIKNSPDINTDKPVSRQMETYVYDFYGWSDHDENLCDQPQPSISGTCQHDPPEA